jgi:glycine betaine/proline transport system ATP-binding protein
MAGLIEARGLTKVYGRGRSAKPAVDGVDLTVQQGDRYVLMGLSGSGKSTALRMLNRLITPTTGQVRVDGQDLAELGPGALRELRNRRIAMVFQHFALFPHRSVRDNAAYGLHLRGTARREAADRAQQSLELVGLGDWGDARPGELSGGMKQRVGLARALSTDADILLMDEPFSALDPLIRREMQDLLLTLTNQLHRTVVFVTHDLNEAMRLGDTITLLTGGRVAQTGTTAEILARPASDYVRTFIQEVDRLRVLTVADVMTPAEQGGSVNGHRVSPEQTLYEASEQLSRDPATTLAVVSGDRVVGRLSTANIVQAVVPERSAA